MSAISKIVQHVSNFNNFSRISGGVLSVKSNRSYFTYTQSLSQPLDRKPEYVSAKEAFEKCLKSGKFLKIN